MSLLPSITIGLILIGFIILISMKKDMESKLAFIRENMEGEESKIKSQAIIWWIVSATAWGIVSMILIVWSFHSHFG